MHRRFGIAAGIVAAILLSVSGGFWGYHRWRESRILSLHDECRRAQDASEWVQLENAARQWSTLRPSDADCWLFLAIALQEKGDIESSAMALTHLPDQHPKTIPALLELSALQFGPLNRPLQAVQTCQRILKIQPKVLEAHRRIIYFDAMTLQRSSMTKQIYRSIELGTEPREAYVYLMLAETPIFTNGFETVNRWLQNDPESELYLVARTVQLAENLSMLRDPTDESNAQLARAHQILTEYRQRFPTNRVVLWYFLKNAARQSDVEKVGKLLAEIPPDAGDESLFWRYRGWYHAQVEEHKEAEAAYRRAGELTPLDSQIWHELADVLRRLGKLPEANAMQSVAAHGRQLRLEIQKLNDAASITDTLLDKVRIYAEACGDYRVGQALRRRFGLPFLLDPGSSQPNNSDI
jgi:tetratricopeptide (TPR) repeat protein